MKERIKRLIEEENINSSQFADKIGINRSIISHILSGRNKPSLDIIIKILDTFPNINIDWLVKGEGDVYKVNSPPNLFNDQNTDKSLNKIGEEQQAKYKRLVSHKRTKYLENDNSTNSLNKEVKRQNNIRTIDKIIVFYSDKTFEEFKS